MDEDTPVWLSQYGSSSGIAVTGAKVVCGKLTVFAFDTNKKETT